MRLFLAVALAATIQLAPAMAVEPSEMLADQELEARARVVSKGLRCVVCRNQDIDGSNAGIARDMRIVLRERIVAGDSNKEAIQFLVDRYGAYVLLRPPFRPSTYALWAGPFVFLALAGFGFSRRFRTKTAPTPVASLDEDERNKINNLLNQVETK